MNEFELIAKISKVLGKTSSRVRVGIGDDCLVAVPPKQNLISTIDSQVEGVHFNLKYTQPEDLGHKALAVNLSDIAAMGGKPLYALVSLGLPKKTGESFVLKMYRAMGKLARKYHCDIAGGNISRSPNLFVDICIIGENKRPHLRNAGRVGDKIYLTGYPGLSACGLALLHKFGRKAEKQFPMAVKRHLRPEPRLAEAQKLGVHHSIGCMIDVSDGLSSELHHLAKASGVKIEINLAKVPVHPELGKAAALLKIDPRDWIFNGGEDYELLFSARQMTPRISPWVTEIGVLKKGRGVNLLARGFHHF